MSLSEGFWANLQVYEDRLREHTPPSRPLLRPIQEDDAVDGLPPLAVPRFVLMNPGPVVTSARVKAAMGVDVSHRDTAFSELMTRLEARIQRAFRANAREHSVVLLSGSGTAMVEAVLSTFVPSGQRVLVVQNGAFGERLQEIATVHGVAAEPLRYGWGEQVRPEQVAARLAADPGIYAVAMVHHETSVGTLNPIAEVGAVVAQHGRRFFADCISSLGGEHVDVAASHIDVAISCGNKCLHAAPGLAFACVRRDLWPEAEGHAPRSVYLDLRRYHRFHEDLRQPPFTPSVPAAFALDAALEELEHEGLDARVSRYAALARFIRAGLEALGLRVVNDGPTGTRVLSCVTLPPGVPFAALASHMRGRGYIIYDGKGPLSGRVMQIAHMGALTPDVVRGFLTSLASALDAIRGSTENVSG